LAYSGWLLDLSWLATSPPRQRKRSGFGPAVVPVSDAALTAPARNIYGKVRSISGHVLTLEAEGRDMAVIVDENTQVLARGAGWATVGRRRRSADRRPRSRRGHCQVEYRANGAMRAVEIQIKGRNTIASR
jgi:hypothetical protein